MRPLYIMNSKPFKPMFPNTFSNQENKYNKNWRKKKHRGTFNGSPLLLKHREHEKKNKGIFI